MELKLNILKYFMFVLKIIEVQSLLSPLRKWTHHFSGSPPGLLWY